MRNSNGFILAVVSMAIGFGDASLLVAQMPQPFEAVAHEPVIVESSAQVIREIMAIPAKGIPTSLLAEAEGLVIVPHMLKGGFVIGVKHGRGVVLARDPVKGWQAPQFITITGGSVGWQAGVQATDLVLVFKTKKSLQGLLAGKFTIGADASAAAGPVGRDTSAATDGKLQAEIYSYSRSRGLFVGLALDGSELKIDRNATDAYYRPQVAVPAGQSAPLPTSALQLIEELNKYTMKDAKAVANGPANVAMVPVAASAAAANPQAVREQLAAASKRLGELLDDPWRKYLALPAETYGGDRFPTAEALEQAAKRFQTVASNPTYSSLTSRPEFVETSQLLQQLVALSPRTALALPPPPPQ